MPPRMYAVDTNTLVGGKDIQFEIPGQTTTVKEEQFTTPQAGLVTIPDASLGNVSGCIIQIQAPAVVVQIVILMDRMEDMLK